jgi:tellurite resistance protein
MAKKTMLQMCCLAAAEDGILTNAETELLRAIADAIGAGIPPFVWNTQLGKS